MTLTDLRQGQPRVMRHLNGKKCNFPFLAHLSQRLIGELIDTMVRRPSLTISNSSLKPLGHQSQILCGASLGRGTQVCSRHLGHMTKMAARPIYGKTLQKSSLQNSRSIFTNLVCSIGDSTHHSLFKWWPWSDLDLFYGKVKFGNLRFSIEKSENCWFSEHLQPVTWNKLKKRTYVNIEGQGHFLTLAQGPFTYKT